MMSGTEARTDAGFKEKVVAKVLSAQTIQLEIPDGKGGLAPGKLHVYHISRPLEGGIAAPSSVDELSQKAISQYLGMLRGMPEAEEPFAILTDVVQDIKTSLSSGDDSAEGKCALAVSLLRTAVDNAAQDLLTCSMYDGETSDGLSVASRQVYVSLESWACEQLHSSFMSLLRQAKADDIASLHTALQAYAGEGQQQKLLDTLEINKKFRIDYTPVVDRICSLGQQLTPLSKLHCLRDSCADIVTCVERALDAKGVDLSEVDLGADDVLGILTYVLVQAHSRGPVAPGCPTAAADLPAQLAFIQRLRQPGCGALDKSQLGYVFANVGQALGYFGATAGEDEVW